jgi:chemotaxis signal transduction protein
MRALLLPVADELYAVELALLRTVVGDPQLFTIPTAPPSVAGVLNLRGEIVAVLDTAHLLGIGRLATIGFAAVVDHPHGAVALAAEGQPRTVMLGEQVAAGDLPGTVGCFTAGQAIATLIDIHTLLVPAAA